MKINGIKSIKNNAGEWLVLTDFGGEGLCIMGQYKTPEEAIQHLTESGENQAIVRLVDFVFGVSA